MMAAMTICLAGCNSDDSDTKSGGKNVVRTITNIENFAGVTPLATTQWSYTYDSAGRMASQRMHLLYTQSNEPDVLTNYDYYADSIVVTVSQEGRPFTRSTTYLTENGLIVKNQTTTYSYDAQGYLKQAVSEESTSNYTWKNGMLAEVERIYSNENNKVVETFEASSVPTPHMLPLKILSALPLYQQHEDPNLIAQGFFGHQSACLPQTISRFTVYSDEDRRNVETYNYSYELKDGLVVSYTVGNGTYLVEW